MALAAALLLLAIVRNNEPTPAPRAAQARSPSADVPVRRTAGASRNTPAESARTAAPPMPHATAETEPSAECLAARAEEAAAKAELAAMTPAQVEAAIDAVARESVEGEQKVVRELARAEDACRGRDGEERDQCLSAHGLDTSEESAEDQAASRQFEAELRSHAFRLAGRGDARSLVAAAIGAPYEKPDAAPRSDSVPPSRIPESVDWIVRAQALGRDDVAVQWAVATFSTLRPGPEPAALLAAKAAARARLLALEPDNSAAFLLSLNDKGTPGYSRADLARAAALPKYRTLDAAAVNLMLDATQDIEASPTLLRALRDQAKGNHQEHPVSAACASDAELLRELRLTMAVVMAIVAKPPIPIMSCRPEDLGDSAQARNDCLRLSEKLHAGGNASDRAIAAAIARRNAPPGAVRERWQQRYRTNRWRQLQMQTASAVLDPYEQVRIIERAWRSGNENLALDEMIARAGLPLEPPPEWQLPPDG